MRINSIRHKIEKVYRKAGKKSKWAYIRERVFPGEGRPDIVLYPNRPKDHAFIFEIKTREKFNQIDDGIKEAFDQIKDKRYEEGILDDGYAGVVSLGVCCCKKSCIIEQMQ